MTDVPANDGPARPGPRLVAWALGGCCVLLAACGGGDRSAALAPSPAPPQAASAAALQSAGLPRGQGIVGQTSVALNPQVAASPASAPVAASTGTQPADPAAIVAIARDSQGNVRLQQRDGAIREVKPDGTMALHPGNASEPMAADLPPSLMVAIDSTNTVHLVDSEGCLARRVAPDGRVTSTSLPAASPQQPCAAVPRPR